MKLYRMDEGGMVKTPSARLCYGGFAGRWFGAAIVWCLELSLSALGSSLHRPPPPVRSFRLTRFEAASMTSFGVVVVVPVGGSAPDVIRVCWPLLALAGRRTGKRAAGRINRHTNTQHTPAHNTHQHTINPSQHALTTCANMPFSSL